MNTKRSLWRVGAGLGKSHLLSFIAMLLHRVKLSGAIYIVYSTQELLDKDSEMINAVKNLIKAEKRIKTTVAKASIKPKPDDVVLIDELDEVYFSNLSWFDKTFRDTTVVGFTATFPTHEENTEKAILAKFFGENIFDSKLKLALRDGETELDFATVAKINEGAMMS